MDKAQQQEIDWSTRDTAEGTEAICRLFFDWSQRIAEKTIRNHPGQDPHHIRSSAAYGLLDAVRKFDPDRSIKFMTFAAYRIKGEIMDAMRDNDHLSRMSRTWVKQRMAAESELLAELHRTPSPEEVCERLGWSTDQYWLSLGGKLRSIYAKKYAGDRHDATLADHLGDKRTAKAALHSDDNLDEIMKGFSIEERTIIYLLYFRAAHMHQIAAAMGVKESRISQIHKAVIERLKELPERFT